MRSRDAVIWLQPAGLGVKRSKFSRSHKAAEKGSPAHLWLISASSLSLFSVSLRFCARIFPRQRVIKSGSSPQVAVHWVQERAFFRPHWQHRPLLAGASRWGEMGGLGENAYVVVGGRRH